jgi:hypothetical protein
MKTKTLRFTLCLALLLVTASASARIVNIQSLIRPDLPDGLQGEIGGSVTYRTGNVDLLLGKASFLASYRAGDHVVISSSLGELGVTGGEDFLERVFSHLRHQWVLGDTFTWETFGQVATDRFKRLKLRGLAGMGPRLSLVQGPAVSVAWGLAYMFETEELNTTSGLADSGQTDQAHRLSTYITAKFMLSSDIGLMDTVYYQPRMDDFGGDWRVLNQLDVSLKLSKKFALVVGYQIGYDTATPESIKELDTSTHAKLVMGF